LFSFAGEQNATHGDEMCVFEFQGWKIAPFICYDLRFPAWIRKTLLQDRTEIPQCLLFVANWPSARIPAWDALLKARAIENQAYVVGVNRIGNDKWHHHNAIPALRFDGDAMLPPHERRYRPCGD
jgi:predicted amidohydrolase